MEENGKSEIIAKHDNRSIGALKPISYWLTVIISSFVTSLTVVTGIIALLNWYETPNNISPDIKTRLVVSAFIIVICLSIIGFSIFLIKDYRRRYHLHRDRGLIRDLYPDRTRLYRHYGDVLEKTKINFSALGISLHTLITSDDFKDSISKSLSTSKELNIHLIFLKPYSQVVVQREKEEERPYGRISQDCASNIQKALKIKNELGEQGSRFHVYVCENVAPIAFLLQSDDEIYFEPYLHRSIGRTCPTFVLAKNKNNVIPFLKFRKHIQSIIDSSQKKEFEELKAHCLHTSFGKQEERSHIRSAIFLDRDGVIVEDTGYISDPNQLHLLPGVTKALKELQKKYRLIVVTNQSGIARGYFSENDLEIINKRLIAMLEDHGAQLDAIYYCPHHPTEGSTEYRVDCNCRKPKPGLIHLAAKDYNIDLNKSFIIGDKEETDILAGKTANIRTVQIIYNDIKTLNNKLNPDFTCRNLLEITETLLNLPDI